MEMALAGFEAPRAQQCIPNEANSSPRWTPHREAPRRGVSKGFLFPASLTNCRENWVSWQDHLPWACQHSRGVGRGYADAPSRYSHGP